MNRLIIAAAAVALFAAPAFADEKPSDDEAKALTAAASALGCSGGQLEKESEASGVFEVNDAKCKDGQFDIKFDKDFKLLNLTKD
ncbi:MAG: hypothetical protein Q7T86_01905 [Hyphomicrobiaceae bacterium]|nr:hypothetical protein [Hyphomicrobiaceae bacterium]